MPTPTSRSGDWALLSVKITMEVLVLKKTHYCGQGFRGVVVKTKGLVFCGTCGHEFKS